MELINYLHFRYKVYNWLYSIVSNLLNLVRLIQHLICEYESDTQSASKVILNDILFQLQYLCYFLVLYIQVKNEAYANFFYLQDTDYQREQCLKFLLLN